MRAWDDLGRPSKDLYFMNLCWSVAMRSIDDSSKCGCVIVNECGAILSTGYNNPVMGSNDCEVDMTRPNKYFYMEHSERNAIYLAARHGISLKNSTFYVTGIPCIDCLRGIIQSGAKKIVYGPSRAFTVTNKCVYDALLKDQNIVIERFKFDAELYQLNRFAKDAMQKKKDLVDIRYEYNLGLAN